MSFLFDGFLLLNIMLFGYISSAIGYYVDFSLSNLIYSITHNSHDEYVLYFYAVSPDPTNDDILFHQLSNQPFVVYPYPLIPIANQSWLSDLSLVQKAVRRYSRKQYDAIITPVCTTYYSWSTQPKTELEIWNNNFLPRNDTRIPSNLTSSFPYTKVLLDFHGRKSFEELLSFRLTTVSVYIKNCDNISINYDYKAAPLVLVYSTFHKQIFLLEKYQNRVRLDHDCAVDVRQLHRKLYWKGNAYKSELHYEYHLPSYATVKHGEDVSKCLTTIPKYMSICSDLIMSILTLSRYVHNYTILLYDRDNFAESSKLLILSITSERQINEIKTTIGGGQETLETYQMTQVHQIRPKKMHEFERVANIENVHLHYCRRSDINLPKLQFSVWLDPFSKYAWSFVILLGTIDLVVHSMSSLSYLKIVSVKYNLEFGRYYFFAFMTCAMLMKCYYENGITSLVTAPSFLQGFTSLRELLENKYTIVISYFGALGNVFLSVATQGFSKTFGVSVANTSIKYVLAKNSRELFKVLANGFYAYPVLGSYANFENAILHQSMNTSSSITCFKSPFSFDTTTEVFRFELANADWYMLSVGWLENAGLPSRWREWSMFAEGIRSKLNYGMSESSVTFSIHTIDDIKKEKIFIILMLIAVLHLFAIILLLVERVAVSGIKNMFRFLVGAFISSLSKVKTCLDDRTTSELLLNCTHAITLTVKQKAVGCKTKDSIENQQRTRNRFNLLAAKNFKELCKNCVNNTLAKLYY